MRYSKYIRVTLIILSIFLSLNFTYSQKVDCINVQDITVPLINNQYRENTSTEEDYNYNLIYYSEEDEYTFWYKLNVINDCKLSFYISPSNPDDEYDYNLFSYTNINFCEALVNNQVSPINITNYETISKGKEKRNIANQKEFVVKKGEIYYLSVINIIGEGCGHQLYIKTDNKSAIINTIQKPCFVFSQPEVEDYISENANENINSKPIENNKSNSQKIESDNNEQSINEVEIIVEDSVNVLGFVRDNETGKKITAKIVFEDIVTGKLYHFNSNDKDGFNMTLERSRRYKLTCSGLGYYTISGVIEFMKPSTYDFYLLKIKEGESFIANNIQFYENTYALIENSIYELEELANYMNMNKAIEIEIQAHTADNKSIDNINPQYAPMGKEWNYTGNKQKLSELRAETVKHYLTENGIISNRITTKGYGASNKISDANERIEIKVTKREKTSTEFKPSTLE